MLKNEDVRVHNSQKSNVWYVHERHNDSLGVHLQIFFLNNVGDTIFF